MVTKVVTVDTSHRGRVKVTVSKKVKKVVVKVMSTKVRAKARMDLVREWVATVNRIKAREVKLLTMWPEIRRTERSR